MNQHLINLLLAVSAGELFHSVAESQQVIKKVSWLKNSLAGKPYYDSLPFAIDRRWKSYGISALGFLVVTGTCYTGFSLLDLDLRAGLWTAIVLLVLAYAAKAVILDVYHVRIAAITPTRPARKQ